MCFHTGIIESMSTDYRSTTTKQIRFIRFLSVVLILILTFFTLANFRQYQKESKEVSVNSLISSAERAYNISNYDEAEKLLIQYNDIIENDVKQDSPFLIKPLNMLAEIYSFQQWEVTESEKSDLYQKVINNYDKLLNIIKVNHNTTSYPMSSMQYLLILEKLAYDYSRQGKEHQAKNLFMELLSFYDSHYGEDSIHSIPIFFGLIELYGYSDLDNEIQQLYERITDIYDLNHDNTTLQWVEMLRTISIHFELSKQVIKSEEMLVQAVKILEENHNDSFELKRMKKKLEGVQTKVECAQYGWSYGPKCKGMNTTGFSLY